jgi:hypothetical protein
MGLVADDFFHYGQDVYLKQQTLIPDVNRPTLGLTLDEIRLCYGDFIAEYHQAFIRGLTF